MGSFTVVLDTLRARAARLRRLPRRALIAAVVLMCLKGMLTLGVGTLALLAWCRAETPAVTEQAPGAQTSSVPAPTDR